MSDERNFSEFEGDGGDGTFKQSSTDLQMTKKAVAMYESLKIHRSRLAMVVLAFVRGDSDSGVKLAIDLETLVYNYPSVNQLFESCDFKHLVCRMRDTSFAAKVRDTLWEYRDSHPLPLIEPEE